MSAEPQADLVLLELWRGGDSLAGNRLVRRHFSRVYRFFRSKLDSGADDLAQQTFLAVVEGRDRIRDGSSFKGYVFGVARRQLLMALRTRYRRPDVVDLGELSMSAFAGPPSQSPSAIVAQRHEQRLLIAALRTLALDYQIALELHYWEEMSVAEIADVLEVAGGTIKSRLSRGRSALSRAVDRMASQQGLLRMVDAARGQADTRAPDDAAGQGDAVGDRLHDLLSSLSTLGEQLGQDADPDAAGVGAQ